MNNPEGYSLLKDHEAQFGKNSPTLKAQPSSGSTVEQNHLKPMQSESTPSSPGSLEGIDFSNMSIQDSSSNRKYFQKVFSAIPCFNITDIGQSKPMAIPTSTKTKSGSTKRKCQPDEDTNNSQNCIHPKKIVRSNKVSNNSILFNFSHSLKQTHEQQSGSLGISVLTKV